MKTKRLLRLIAILLSLCMCAAMHPDIVSAEESNQETYDQGILYNTYDFGSLGTDDINAASIPEDSALTVYSSSARNAALVGVKNDGHDHDSALRQIRTNLTNCGFNNATVYSSDKFGTSDIDSYLDDNNVFVSRSHGNYFMNEIFSDEQDGTYLVLTNIEAGCAEVRYCSNGSMSTLDLHNLELAMFVGCYTGYGGIIEDNLVTQAIFQGAKAALGFTESINCNQANVWLKRLFALLEQGMTLREACQQLHSDGNFQETTMAYYVIDGNASITLTTG